MSYQIERKIIVDWYLNINLSEYLSMGVAENRVLVTQKLLNIISLSILCQYFGISLGNELKLVVQTSRRLV